MLAPLRPAWLLAVLAALYGCGSSRHSQLLSQATFRGGRMRPIDQIAMESKRRAEGVMPPNKPAATKVASPEDLFRPMLSSVAAATLLSAGPSKTAKKISSAAYNEERTRATTRTYNTKESTLNTFVFPSDPPKTSEAYHFSMPLNPHKASKEYSYPLFSEAPHVYALPSDHSEAPEPYLPEAGKTHGFPVTETRNATSRFFSFNTNRQALDLGLSFTVPFLSIPMKSLLNIGETTTAALYEMLAVNWPSIVAIGLAVVAASFLLPTLVQWASGLMVVPNAYGYGASGVPAYGGTGGYYDYARSFEVSPIASLLSQLDDALSQYDLDATSCMQRTVCSYVADAEESVGRGNAGPTQMIVNGISRSMWLRPLFGQSALSKALEVGRSGGNCQKHYPKCPFSLAGVLRFLASYATLL